MTTIHIPYAELKKAGVSLRKMRDILWDYSQEDTWCHMFLEPDAIIFRCAKTLFIEAWLQEKGIEYRTYNYPTPRNNDGYGAHEFEKYYTCQIFEQLYHLTYCASMIVEKRHWRTFVERASHAFCNQIGLTARSEYAVMWRIAFKRLVLWLFGVKKYRWLCKRIGTWIV